MRFKTYTLSQLATIKYGKNQKNVLSDDGGIPIYGTGGLMGYANSSLYDKPSVLIGRKGTIEKVRYVTHPFWTVDTLFYTIINEDLILPYYLYCVISAIDLKQYNEGTTIPSLRTETLNRLEFKIPPLETQKKIASILSALDDKIELNNAINKNLEEQAGALFKSWFVDFEPFGGVMPSGWEASTLGSIANITSGKRPSIKQSERTNDISIPIVGAASIMGYTKDILYNEKILVTGRVGTHGVIQRFNSPCWASDNTLVITSKLYEYVYQILKGIEYTNMNRGSTQPLITQTDLKNVGILIPSKEILFNFEQLACTLMKQLEKNQLENQSLSNLRDTLLPKLMSGELDVSEIDI